MARKPSEELSLGAKLAGSAVGLSSWLGVLEGLMVMGDFSFSMMFSETAEEIFLPRFLLLDLASGVLWVDLGDGTRLS